ncbi:MAG: hypothetical protein FJ290_11580 [Planctomycetes bacterium]|nr:hypothetical protein [Planctomycetota bacterium]
MAVLFGFRVSGFAFRLAGMGLMCVLLAGCGGSGDGGPPRLTRTYQLPDHAEKMAIGAGGRVFYTTSPRGGMGPMGPMGGGPTNEVKMVEADSTPGYPLKLEGGAEVKAVATDGAGSLYLGVREGGKDELWVFGETWGEKAEAKAKRKLDLPGDLNALFLGREAGTLFALCGDKFVVKLRGDGTVERTIELPGDSRPESGGVDAEGNLYVRRGSGPIVKVKPDGSVDPAWAKSAAAALDYVRAVAVDSKGRVYVAASEGGVYLRAFDASGALLFNIVAKQLEYAPDALVVTPRDVLYGLDGRNVYEFRP